MKNILNEAARHELPQITDWKEFQNDLLSHDIFHDQVKVNPDNLIPTQDELDKEKVRSIAKSGAYDPNAFILISNDNKIVDGHHRQAAMKDIGNTCSCVKVELLYPELIEFLRNKPYTMKKGMLV